MLVYYLNDIESLERPLIESNTVGEMTVELVTLGVVIGSSYGYKHIVEAVLGCG